MDQWGLGTKSFNADGAEEQFVAECNDLTLVILRPAVQMGDSAVSRHDDLLLGIANNQRSPDIHLTHCRRRYGNPQDNKGKAADLFEIELVDTGMSSAGFSFDHRMLRVINYHIYVSWDGTRWYSLLGFDPMRHEYRESHSSRLSGNVASENNTNAHDSPQFGSI